MISFPNCKINLGLHILNKREDGFHNLETVFYPIGLKDVLEVIPSQQKETEFAISGIPLDANTNDNICMKAYRLLQKDFPQLPTVKIHLHKAIPSGAGLGGGSADGAFVLKILNDKFKLGLSEQQLIDYALLLGSDCPFFIINKPCYATSRGEILEEISADLSPYKIVLINPGIHINTGWAFSQLTPGLPAKPVKEVIVQPIATWKNELINDFEKVVFPVHPQIKKIKEDLYTQGALYASMSGSGSTVFGIFHSDSIIPSFPGSNYYIKMIN